MKKLSFLFFLLVSVVFFTQSKTRIPSKVPITDTVLVQKKQYKNCFEFVILKDTLTNRMDTLQILNCFYVEKTKKKK